MGIHNELYVVIKKDISPIINSRILNNFDREDIINEIQVKVFKNIYRFVMCSDEYSEAERNGWLKKITINTLNDYYRNALIKIPRKKADSEDQIRTALLQSSGWDEDVRFYENTADDSVDIDYLVEKRQELILLLTHVLGLNSKPEKIMVFLIMIFEQQFYYRGLDLHFSGYMESKLKNLSFFDLKMMLERMLDPLQIPAKVYDKLNSALNEQDGECRYGDRLFEADARMLIVWLSELRRRLRAGKTDILMSEEFKK